MEFLKWFRSSDAVLFSSFKASIDGVGKLGAELREAVRAADTEKVKSLLDEGADVNAQDIQDKTRKEKGGATPLMIASRNGHGDIVEMLLAKGAKVNATINMGRLGSVGPTSSYELSHIIFITLPLIYRDLIKTNCLNGVTALMIASNHGHGKIVEMLLAKGAKVNVRNESGMTALMFASMSDHRDIVEMLLAKGAKK